MVVSKGEAVSLIFLSSQAASLVLRKKVREKNKRKDPEVDPFICIVHGYDFIFHDQVCPLSRFQAHNGHPAGY